MVEYDSKEIAAYFKFIDWINKVYKEPVIKFTFDEFSRLPFKDMNIICLHFIDNLSYKKIGDIYGCSRSNIERIIRYAFRKLNRGDYDNK